MSYVTAALIAAALVLIAFIVYKKYYQSSSEAFSGGFDPSTRYSVAGIGPSYANQRFTSEGSQRDPEYTQPDECPNCQ